MKPLGKKETVEKKNWRENEKEGMSIQSFSTKEKDVRRKSTLKKASAPPADEA